MIQAEIGWGEADLQEVCAPHQMEDADLRGEPDALLQQIGDIFRGEGLIDQDILHGPDHGLSGVDIAQDDDFLRLGSDGFRDQANADRCPLMDRGVPPWRRW